MAQEATRNQSLAEGDVRPAANPTAVHDGGHPRRPPWSRGAKDWAFAAALLLAVVLIYQPAWNGGFIWDDDIHVTRPELLSAHGLFRIWTDVRATPQYYPLLHSAFWLQRTLWGDHPLGYHLVNIVLHATAAILVALLLRRLAIPGAALAAAIFALHPVHVESVAWISELKNVLSANFYLAAAIAYLRFDETRKLSWYGAALALFIAALLCKTVTGTLPWALLVVLWWRRGRLSWGKDVLPLAPWIVMGIAGALVTAWWELEVNESRGADLNFNAIERVLIAGRAAWFHLEKLFWPAKLTFSYPRWRISQYTWWQYGYPLALAALFAALWSVQRRTRAPLAALLLFCGTLVPVLGFFNLYTFRFSFVADHYQYLACLGIIAIVAAALTSLIDRLALPQRVVGHVACMALLTTLAVLTWRQSRTYADAETLYRATIDRNPDCWLAHNNLGLILAGRGEVDEAIAHFQKALDIQPDHVQAHNNLGLALADRGESDEAIAHYRKALDLKPDFAEARYNLGLALAGRGQVDDAIAQYQNALELRPDYALAHNNLGKALAGRGQVDEAIIHFRKALLANPDLALAHNNLGLALAGCGQFDEAIAHFRKALEIGPDHAEVHNNLGLALAGCGQFDDAIVHFRKALETKPDFMEAHNNLGNALARCGQVDGAIAHFRKALEIKPDYADPHNNLGILLVRRGHFDEAVAHYHKALEINPDYLEAHYNLGLALAGRGRLDEALEHYQKALGLASARNDRALANVNRGANQAPPPGRPCRQCAVRGESR